MEELYQKKEPCDWKKLQKKEPCDWKTLQKLAMENCDSEIRAMVLDAQQKSVRIPAVRQVTKAGKFVNTEDGKFEFSTEEGDTSRSVKEKKIIKFEEKQIIVCDIVSILRFDLPFVSSLMCIEPSI